MKSVCSVILFTLVFPCLVFVQVICLRVKVVVLKSPTIIVFYEFKKIYIYFIYKLFYDCFMKLGIPILVDIFRIVMSFGWVGTLTNLK